MKRNVRERGGGKEQRGNFRLFIRIIYFCPFLLQLMQEFAEYELYIVDAPKAFPLARVPSFSWQ